MLKKVSCWGHREDKDWKTLVEKEFSKPFRGKDCLYDLTYRNVDPFCNPLDCQLPTSLAQGPFQNVTKVNRQSLLRIQLNQ